MFDPRWRLGAPDPGTCQLESRIESKVIGAAELCWAIEELLRELTMLTPSCILLVSIKQVPGDVSGNNALKDSKCRVEWTPRRGG